MTRIIHELEEWKLLRKKLKKENKEVGLVPTMGGLHAGHRSLMQRSVQENDFTVLSLFVNPTQFNQTQDLENYPQTFEQDHSLCEKEGVDCILNPSYESLYPDDYHYRVSENQISLPMEGKFRPGHFDGVLSIVLKLLLLTQADRCYFGEKDYQQYQLCKGMAEAFFVDCRIIACPTIREADGLACSTRNTLLNAQQRHLAPLLFKELCSKKNRTSIVEDLKSKGFCVEYVEEHQNRRFAAATLGKIRLIDNVPL